MPNVDENLHVVPPPIIAPPRRSVRERRSVIPDDYVTYFVEGESDLTDPVSYHQAINNRFAIQWCEAMKDELKSMAQNSVWELKPLRERFKAVNCK